MKQYRSRLAASGAFFVAGCLGTATLDNDGGTSGEPAAGQATAAPGTANNPSPAVSSPEPTMSAGGSGAAIVPPSVGSPPGSGGTTLAGPGEGQSPGAPESAGGGGTAAMAGGLAGAGSMAGAGGMAGAGSLLSREQAALLVAGTAEGCNSFTEQSAETCGSYYCNVDEATLTAALDPSGVCGVDRGNGGGDFVCSARPVTLVGACAREVKSANVFASNDELRPLIRSCVYEDAEMLANTTEPCLDCFIDLATCAADNCLFACLTGDSLECDSCRADNNCERPLFACAGLPDPF